MPVPNENLSAVGVQTKTGVVTSAKMALAVAFLGAAALAAAAVGFGGKNMVKLANAGSYGYGYGYGNNSSYEPVLKGVDLWVQGSYPVLEGTSQSAVQGNLSDTNNFYYDSKNPNGDVFVVVNSVKYETPDTVYGYFVSYDSYYPIKNAYPYFKEKIVDKIVWTKSKQYSFKYKQSDFFVYVLTRNKNNIFGLSNLQIDDGTYLHFISTGSTTSTAPTSTPPAPVVKPQPILKLITAKINSSPSPILAPIAESAAQGNLPDIGSTTTYFMDTKPTSVVDVKVVSVDNADANTLYGYYVSYNGGYSIMDSNQFFKENVTDKAVWTKSKSYSFKYKGPYFYVYVLVKNNDTFFPFSNLGIDDGTFLSLTKKLPSVPPTPTSTPSSTPSN